MSEVNAHHLEHFQDLEQQAHAARLGIWVFLASELLLFAGLFALYGAYRAHYPAAFGWGVEHNVRILGTLNTAILISSSYSVATSVHMMRKGRARLAAGLLAFTLLCGCMFLFIKGIEYAGHFREGVFPGGPGVALPENPEGQARRPSHASTRHRRGLLAPDRRGLDLSLAHLLPDAGDVLMTSISQRTTLLTLLALLGLTATSFAISYVHLGALNIPVALAIACVKAALVVTVFMELAVEKLSVKLSLVMGFVFVVLLVGLMVADVATRAAAPLLPPPPS
jgi:caa(3)-type oxidase subunit IV